MRKKSEELSKNDSYAISKMESINFISRFLFLFSGWIFQLVQKKHMHKRKLVIHEMKEKRKLLAIVEELWQKQ